MFLRSPSLIALAFRAFLVASPLSWPLWVWTQIKGNFSFSLSFLETGKSLDLAFLTRKRAHHSFAKAPSTRQLFAEIHCWTWWLLWILTPKAGLSLFLVSISLLPAVAEIYSLPAVFFFTSNSSEIAFHLSSKSVSKFFLLMKLRTQKENPFSSVESLHVPREIWVPFIRLRRDA